MTPIKPLLRWAGSKKKLLPAIHALLPRDLDLSKNRLFEPFFGSGALTFSLGLLPEFGISTKKFTSRPIVANDVNDELITFYRVLEQQPQELIDLLQKMSHNVSEKRYYEVRDQQPADEIEVAARLLYLNRTGFNGLFRVNGQGKFNVPYGRLSKPKICVPSEFEAVSKWLAFVELRSGPFEQSVIDARDGDFVYFDPPYIPLSATSSFSKYSKLDFGTASQEALRDTIRELTDRNVRVMLSNSDTELTAEIFADVLKNWRTVPTRRSIAAKSESRMVVTEVLATNYDLDEALNPGRAASLTSATEV